jgi:hypothetical protein
MLDGSFCIVARVMAPAPHRSEEGDTHRLIGWVGSSDQATSIAVVVAWDRDGLPPGLQLVSLRASGGAETQWLRDPLGTILPLPEWVLRAALSRRNLSTFAPKE